MENNKIIETAKKAHDAFLKTMNFKADVKNEALTKICEKLKENKDKIFSENKKDIESAKELLANGEINKAIFDRLKLDESKLNSLIKGLEDLIQLEDPINKILWQKELDQGLILKK